MTLYLKYRSQTIDELDLESVREQLKKIVASGNIPHGLLFSGPKGSGKTSAARILAKIINCERRTKDDEPCNKCQSCLEIARGNNLDVIEIDAASNRGIDDIRSLKENIMLAPSRSSKKIYIVDEAHMLTLEASNAFLKTLEEPPEHVIFILATTEPLKLPETVRSRLVSISFQKGTEPEIERQLTRGAKGEKIEIEKDAIKKIAKIADGSFRDAIKAFEQTVLSGNKKISGDLVDKFVFTQSTFKVEDFTEIIQKKNAAQILAFIKKLVDEGISTKTVIDSLIEESRARILEGDSIHLIELLIEARGRLKDSFIAELPLEIALVKYCSGNTKIEEKSMKSEVKTENRSSKIDQTSTPKEVIHFNRQTSINSDVWAKILVNAKAKNTTIEALLRAAEPLGYDGHSLTLGVYYKFHKERLEALPNKRTLEEVITGIFGNPVEVVYTLTEKKQEPKIEPILPVGEASLTDAKDNDIISAAKEIFGQ